MAAEPRLMPVLVGIVVVAFPGARGAWAADWPMHSSDPAHSGISPETGLAPPLAARWSYSMGGSAVAVPLVWSGLLYLGSGPSYQCRTADGGCLVWSYGMGGEAGGVVEAGVVYKGFDDGQFRALSATTGALVWSHVATYPYALGLNLGAGLVVGVDTATVSGGGTNIRAINASNGTLAWSHWYPGGAAQAPTIWSGRVYATYWDGSGGKLLAHDVAGGSFLWSFLAGGTAPRMRTTASATGGQVFFAHQKIFALNAVNGQVNWSYALGGYADLSGPTFHGGIVYCGCDDWKMYAVDEGSGAFLWSFYAGGEVACSASWCDGFLYFGTVQSQKILALNAQNGSFVWSHSAPEVFGVNGSPAISNGRIYVQTFNSGIAYCFQPVGTPAAATCIITPSVTATRTPSGSPTETRTVTLTATRTRTLTESPTATESATRTETRTATVTATPPVEGMGLFSFRNVVGAEAEALELYWRVPAGEPVRLVVHNGAGEAVREIWRGVSDGAPHWTAWDARTGTGRSVSSGVYTVLLTGRYRIHRARVAVLR